MSAATQHAAHPWRTLKVCGAVLCAALASGLVARAMPGMAGGQTRSELTFVGTLRGTSGPQKLTFTFKRQGQAACTAAALEDATPDPSTFAFTVHIPLDTCPGSLFDGSDVSYDIQVGGNVVVRDQPLTPVPYARYADHVGTPDCPVGYERNSGETRYVLCQKGTDEVVKVGTGPAAFWIDRYEASVWSGLDGSATQYGAGKADYPAAFPPNGQWRGTAPVAYALSRAGVVPSVWLTWFQAMEACAASGKRLPGRQEWLRAARGTVDPGKSDGTDGSCLTFVLAPRPAGQGSSKCVSDWGAEDMIGNVWEWTDEWHAGAGAWDGTMNTGKLAARGLAPWPPGYSPDGQDATWNLTSHVVTAGAGEADGMPGAVLRGGAWYDGNQAGIFALLVDRGPPAADVNLGFRCVIGR